ncbi:hypothetical protein FSARC_12087 [Fusarium sarcochroum]|uniref:RanBP2-type domain-containing protein n=1 Tax=Fusarium sarcochroum TaxID=1208366 RepID=A0A8H4TAW8_9HYPO|nr:hypothetical protein FSARC_12087 [Fusarium sarcochroum]
MPSFKSLLFTLLLIFTRSGLAAHIQFRDCTEVSATPYQFKPSSLNAFLDRKQNETKLNIRLTGDYPSLVSCQKSLLRNASFELSLAALGGTSRYDGDVRNATCQTLTHQLLGKTFIQALEILFKIDNPPPLAAYKLELNVQDPKHLPIVCVNGFLTPEISPTFPEISFWGPAITFLLVILVAGWREWFNLVHPLRDDDESGQERSSNRSHLTRIADCLTYIQFIFFVGALSLSQPGFLQPVISSVSWSTLMLRRGIVWRHSLYYGVHDGIHEINGTFGGTTGLEHMTQVMGAPVTVNTWTNIITLAVVVLALLFMILQASVHLRWTRDWFQQSGSWMFESSSKYRPKATIWVALRVFLSYLLLPLTAWTTYQLNSANLWPLYYTLLTTLVVCFLLIACWWGMSSRSPQSMGYLLVDNLHKQEPDESISRTQDYYTLVTFGLLFARGVVIGGLQRYGTVQLLVLMACEVAQLGFLAWATAAPGSLSRPVLLAGARLCALLLCLGMVPELWSHTAASALGYTLLVFHALVMVGMFLVPSAYELGLLAATSFHEWQTAPEPPAGEPSEQRPQIFGLRQLSRRPTTRTNLSAQGAVHNDRSSLSSSEHTSIDSPNSSSLASDPVSPELLRTYFRSPRPERSISSLSERNRQFPSFETTRPSTVFESTAESSAESSSQSDGSVDLRVDRGEGLPAWQAILPSNPNVDYSVRETDLYYIRPRRVSFRQTDATGVDSIGGRPAGWADSLKFCPLTPATSMVSIVTIAPNNKQKYLVAKSSNTVQETIANTQNMPCQPTTTVRDDHKYWKCRQYMGDSKVCNHYNEMTDKRCTSCGSRRDKGDKACNGNAATIGEMSSVGKDGTEYWQYDSEQIPVFAITEG